MRPQPRVQCKKHTSVVTTVTPVHPAFPAQWFYDLLRALPGEPGFLATVIGGILPAHLAPASGRQDHTTSPSASATLVSRGCRVHRISPRVRDDSRFAP